MANRTNLCGDFGADLMLSGVVPVPKLLLYNYALLGLQEDEVILILQLISLRHENPYPAPAELAELMGVSSERVENMLGRLIEGKIISIEKIFLPQDRQLVPAYAFSGLMEKLSEIWAVGKARNLEERKKAIKDKSSLSGKLSNETRVLVKAFEQEFGRALSEIECTNIIEWHEGCGFSQEIILEALKRAVLNHTSNWRYINSILREWDKKNIRTLQAVIEDDKRFQEQHQRQDRPRNGKNQGAGKVAPKDKYKDFYL